MDAAKLYRTHFLDTPSAVVQAPGRLELLGNHTDYNLGLVMSLAVDRHIEMAIGRRTDGRIELVSTAFKGADKTTVTRIERNPEHLWADYIKGVLVELKKAGRPFGGFNAAVHGTLPIGAGMSSSAALEVATALAVKRLYPYSISVLPGNAPAPDELGQDDGKLGTREKLAVARLCQAAENQFVGVKCGLLDQISSLFGRSMHAILIDCQDVSVNLVPMYGEIAIIVCNSEVKHALVGGEYNELREQCEAAAAKLGVSSLRKADWALLESRRSALSEREYACARHIVGEIQRVVHGERALRAGDFAQFGQYMFQSHESSRDFFKNSTAELDLLVEIARSHGGCLGARLTGGGFGGATINLVKGAQAREFSAYLSDEYFRRSGVRTEPMLCRISDGAA